MLCRPPKSKLRFMAHNPTGELVWVLTQEWKKVSRKRQIKERPKNF